jgi:mRNA interferase MazF
MKKDFDKWNTIKKEINWKKSPAFCHPREIWWCALGVNIGFEQDGSALDYQRPVLILRGFNEYVCLVLPLTTSTKKNKYHMPLGMIDGKESFAITSQIRLIDTKRLINKVGFIDKEIFNEIRKTVKELL